MLRVLLAAPRALLSFWWDPETTVDDARPRAIRPGQARAVLALVLAVIGALHAMGYLHLTCWTPKFHTPWGVGVLLAGFFALTLAQEAWPAARARLWLWGSLALSAILLPAATALTVAVLVPYALVMRSGAPRWAKWATLFALHLAVMALWHFRWFPAVVFSPVWGPAGLIFAFFVPLRLLWFHHQALRDGAPPVTVAEVFTYFFTLPAVILIPYMFALPRREHLNLDAAPDPELTARGTRYLVAGVLFALSYHALEPAILWAAAATGQKWLIIPWVYPMEPVFWALSSSYILTGLYNRMGAPVTLAFRSPLVSHSVLEWWRRWNVHFRDLLVDIFFYPLVLGRRSHPILRLWIGAFGVFIVGSTVLHWAVKHYFMNNAIAPYWSMFVENGVMFVGVGVLLHLERVAMDRATAARKAARAAGLPAPKPPVTPAWRRALGVPLTYLVVFSSVMGGYATNLIVEGTVVDRPTLVLRHAQALAEAGEAREAAYFRERAREDFVRAVAPHDDLTSPWRIKERHGAVKLILLELSDDPAATLRDERVARLSELLTKLGWDAALARDPVALGARCADELTRYRGIKGLARLGEI